MRGKRTSEDPSWIAKKQLADESTSSGEKKSAVCGLERGRRGEGRVHNGEKANKQTSDGRRGG